MLTGAQKKVAHALSENVRLMAQRYGVSRLGFLTLTFHDDVQEIKEASRRFNSLATNVFNAKYEKLSDGTKHCTRPARYEEWLAVVERTKTGRVHFHVVVVCPVDIKTGFDFRSQYQQRTACQWLRDEWEFWRSITHCVKIIDGERVLTTQGKRRFAFGRTELLPIKKGEKEISRYVGKYISKHLGQREARDKGARLVRYAKAACRWSCRFTWETVGSQLWRTKLGTLAKVFGYTANNYHSKFKELLGARWCYHLSQVVGAVKLGFYRSPQHFLSDRGANHHDAVEAAKREGPFEYRDGESRTSPRAAFTLLQVLAQRLNKRRFKLCMDKPKIDNQTFTDSYEFFRNHSFA